ncbi:nitrite reductase large subunit NirB [Aquimarina algicola]|uniref:Nitrite reductase large subunit n=1 Tax=Aquimarina algicola TaxID=2589995 RepID=A0A504J519_9FLAO|nr:nitrite reductase large subunit NirB [Aquimarina algicola]TPN82199.1 nitrite reductase large subunit [Aquimarina algicola]
MKKVIVIGNGMVGYKFCEKFVASKKYEHYSLTVFGEEPRHAYDRVHLSEYYTGKNSEDLSLSSLQWYTDHNIDLHTSEMITEINRSAKTVSNHRGVKYAYDYLVIATGSSAFVPQIEGIEKEGVFVYRTIEDLEAIESYASKLKSEGKTKAAILGGGLLGLEAANAVKELGLQAHVVEFASKLMPRQLDKGASDMLQATIEELGLTVHLDKQTKNIKGTHAIEGLEYIDHDHLLVDMLVISAGIRPRDEIAKHSGLAIGPRGGIIVDNKMKTSDDCIYAIGEVALYNNMIYGLVAPGYEMANVAVAQITGETDTVMAEDIDMSTQLKLIGTEVASFGNALSTDENIHSIVYENKCKGIYKRINISEDKTKLLGGILIGDSSDYNALFQLYHNNISLPEDPENLILGNREGGDVSPLGNVMDLPNSAQICSCENISKETICTAIQDGTCDTLEDVISCTKAGTGCGGCKPMVKDLVNETLKSLGKEIKDTICEHFDLNRQELFDIIKLKGYRTYDQVLNHYGKGDGCETCKPIIASIMASIYADTANKEEVIQDSNDRFLANIQRNGTYSVVPRIPGGEITPEKLIVLGEIGKKYDLYTKITGGQRIDFFGARLDQLPKIWKELIDHGFESGHAYGKSLRTVKSCVGSTWCRYGMDESVSFAIALENRYKGLRSPHKIKGGVSGCIRECAEARCKDFGVIAVEGGWNLYVCGNGGANPRHAELLAEKIDNENVIKYIDRFLMFYIRTAAPLERTAKWLDNLDGGIEYLKKVVIDDKLGLADELELEMQQLVNHFQCEWTQAIQNEEIMKRFNHFVNSDDTDDSLVFVPLREQKMPQPWQ